MAALSICGFRIVAARLFTLALAAAAIAWAIVVVPLFWSEAFIVQAATHIIAGETYRPDVMKALIVHLELVQGSDLRSSTLSKAAILRLRATEDAITLKDRRLTDESLSALAQAADDALMNAPNDSYQWLILFWVNNTRNGFKPEHLRYLKMSYALGPNEGWIAITRNRIALASYSTLSTDLAEAAIVEFVSMVRSGLYTEAYNVVVGLAGPLRHILLARLNRLSESNRRTFLHFLYEKGIDDISMLGIEPKSVRPWQR